MTTWMTRIRRPGWSAVAAVLVGVVVGFVLLASYSLEEGGFGVEVEQPLSDAEVRSLALGGSRDEVERAIGKGESAWEFPLFGATGTAVEPMDATCVYYAYGGRQRVGDLVQLCYRDDSLVSKRVYS